MTYPSDHVREQVIQLHQYPAGCFAEDSGVPVGDSELIAISIPVTALNLADSPPFGNKLTIQPGRPSVFFASCGDLTGLCYDPGSSLAR